jgi:hypothetical protein
MIIHSDMPLSYLQCMIELLRRYVMQRFLQNDEIIGVEK